MVAKGTVIVSLPVEVNSNAFSPMSNGTVDGTVATSEPTLEFQTVADEGEAAHERRISTLIIYAKHGITLRHRQAPL